MSLQMQAGKMNPARVPRRSMDTIFAYVNSLLDPAGNMARVPDSFAGKTATVSSFMFFEVPVSSADQGTNTGRFSVLVQPTLGKTESPRQYKVACVNSAGVWPTDMTNPNSYVNSLSGRDLRIDPQFEALVGPGTALYSLENESAPANHSPWGITSNPLDGTDADWTYQSGITYYNNNNGSGSSLFGLPVGQWMVTIRTSGGSAGTGVVNPTTVEAGVPGLPYIDAQINSYTAGNAWTWIGLVCVTAHGQAISVAQPQTGINRATIIITSTLCPGYPVSLNSGITQKLRPVSMSVLATCIAPKIQTGGTIAAVLLPGDAKETCFFTNAPNPQIGALQTVEAVSQIPGAYTGPFVDGSYTFWKPETRLDVDVRTPDETISYQYPTIVVSGTYLNASGTSTAQPLRIAVTTDYELQTMSRLLEHQACVGTTAGMEEIMALLGALTTTSMANATHSKFLEKIRNVLQQGRSIYNENADWMAPLASKISDLIKRLPFM